MPSVMGIYTPMDDLNVKRLKNVTNLALELNAELPTDIFLKGNGEIWGRFHGNGGNSPRKMTKEEVITSLYTAINGINKLISV